MSSKGWRDRTLNRHTNEMHWGTQHSAAKDSTTSKHVLLNGMFRGVCGSGTHTAPSVSPQTS